MDTYKQIQRCVKENHGFKVKTCWIAHVKGRCGIGLRKTPNRLNENFRANPGPPGKIMPIRQAHKHLGELPLSLERHLELNP